jgi:mannan endo-1,4-beta-mannosidase
MNKLKLASVLVSLAVTASLFTSCKSVKRKNEISINSDYSSGDYYEQPTTTAIIADSYPDYPITFPEINQTETGNQYQAENCDYEGLSFKSERSGYSGKGYVTGFDGDVKSLTFLVDAPSTQHYDIGFSIAADSETQCSIKINDTSIGSFKADSSGKFTLIKMYGIFLTEGSTAIEIEAVDGNIDLDYLQLTNNTTLNEIVFDPQSPTNTEMGKSTTELLDFLKANYGKTIISGQYASDNSNKELDFIYQMTGKYPVIRFSALDTSYSDEYNDYEEIEAIAQWYRNGGIVGLIWQWKAPSSISSVYAEETDFRLSKAVTDIDISTMTKEEIRGLFGEGKISEECYGIILDIDNMATQLLSLKNIGVPVLWRPLHEASGDWYWWGADGAADYKWLWELMYKRMTDYFKLDNLIWIWNGQSADYLVDESMYDIASVDIYLPEGSEFSSRYEQFFSIQKMVGQNKIIALSECSSIPNADDSFRDKSVWSLFGLWFGSYLMNSDGNFSEKYTTKDIFIRSYNSEGVLTLDEYKDLKSAQQTTTQTAQTTTVTQTTTSTT